jgi:hypothetical protein
MSVTPSTAELRAANYGTFYTNSSTKGLPSNGYGTIFTVLGGRILVTCLIGVLTQTVVGTPTLSVGVNPVSLGANQATALCTATSISGAVNGTALAVPDAVTSALIVAASGVIPSPGVTLGQGGIAIVSVGTITMTTSATISAGSVTWTMAYVPIDSGVTVTG